MTATLDGITCPSCGMTGRAVVESRRMPDRVRRRCACSGCGERFTTWELRHDQITHSVNKLAAERATRLLDRFQALEQSMAALRQLLESELQVVEVLGIPDPEGGATCEQCVHWDGRCDLGHPDPLEEGVEFARWCASYQAGAA